MLLTPILLAVLTADAPYKQSIEGVTVELVAISDGAGQVWTPTGGPLPDDAKDWSPKRDPPKYPRGPHKNALFLVHVSAAIPDDINIEASLSGSKMIGIGINSQPGRNTADAQTNTVYQISGVFPEAQETTALEIRVGSGAWTDEGAVAVKKNSLSSYNGTLLDGGRYGNFILQPAGTIDGLAMTAAVSLAMRDTETIYDDYRLIALDADGNIIAETSSASSAGYHKLFLLDCPQGPDKPKPAQYVFQQRPRNALTFESVSLMGGGKE